MPSQEPVLTDPNVPQSGVPQSRRDARPAKRIRCHTTERGCPVTGGCISLLSTSPASRSNITLSSSHWAMNRTPTGEWRRSIGDAMHAARGRATYLPCLRPVCFRSPERGSSIDRRPRATKIAMVTHLQLSQRGGSPDRDAAAASKYSHNHRIPGIVPPANSQSATATSFAVATTSLTLATMRLEFVFILTKTARRNSDASSGPNEDKSIIDRLESE